jgi:nitroreductase
MSFLKLAQARQSVRSYIDKKVEREKIERCLEAARLAPSACNSQPWRFIVVDEPELREKVAKETFGKLISFNHFTMQAPVLVVMITEKSKPIARIGGAIKDKTYNLIDIGIAAEHFCLQAVEEGLGTCMLGWFDKKKLYDYLNIPKSKQIDLIITLGYSQKEEIRPKKRKTIDEIRTYNSFINS